MHYESAQLKLQGKSAKSTPVGTSKAVAAALLARSAKAKAIKLLPLSPEPSFVCHRAASALIST